MSKLEEKFVKEDTKCYGFISWNQFKKILDKYKLLQDIDNNIIKFKEILIIIKDDSVDYFQFLKDLRQKSDNTNSVDISKSSKYEKCFKLVAKKCLGRFAKVQQYYYENACILIRSRIKFMIEQITKNNVS